MLNLVEEDERIGFIAHFIAGEFAKPEIEILDGPDRGETAVLLIILDHIDLDEIGEQLLPHVTDNIGFPDLMGPIDQQYLL